MADIKTVIIVGAGFGGLNAAKALANQPGIYVILIDQKNHHLFQPLLYQVATAGLNAADIAVPIRSQFTDTKNVEVRLEQVDKIDLNTCTVHTRSEHCILAYDFLILACGSQHSYFQHPEWEEFAPGLKTLEQATEIRRRLLLAFENAENARHPEDQKSFLNFVIIGGGPTGVELAGAIADISRTVLIGDFKHIDPSQARIVLVEASPRILMSFDALLSARTQKDLTELGVEVRTSTRVTQMTQTGVQVGNEWIPSQTIFWAAGVRSRKLHFIPNIPLEPSGQIRVTKDLSLPDQPHVFVIGDMAHVEFSPGKRAPGVAPAAIQMGHHAARMILASLHKKTRSTFQYRDHGMMATIGKNRAVLQRGTLRMHGHLAWLAWLFVHVFYLIGFKNRFSVMAHWAWNYLFSQRGARLIMDRSWQQCSTDPLDPSA